MNTMKPSCIETVANSARLQLFLTLFVRNVAVAPRKLVRQPSGR